MAFLRLPEPLREELKKPLGPLVSDADCLEAESDRLIAIGDRTTDELLRRGIKPKVCVYDGLIERKKVGVSEEIVGFEAKEIKLKNPAGKLNEEAFKVIDEAFHAPERHKISVEGEEDLITVAAVEVAPMGAVVVYGQPGEGIVYVKINEETKQKVREIIEEMRK